MRGRENVKTCKTAKPSRNIRSIRVPMDEKTGRWTHSSMEWGWGWGRARWGRCPRGLPWVNAGGIGLPGLYKKKLPCRRLTHSRLSSPSGGMSSLPAAEPRSGVLDSTTPHLSAPLAFYFCGHFSYPTIVLIWIFWEFW